MEQLEGFSGIAVKFGGIWKARTAMRTDSGPFYKGEVMNRSLLKKELNK